ncbi:MAG: hypothetical protein LBR51_07205 [Bacteroidales bacterium]|nr:hypothetical protein [Bacteroidales bacterium]
MKKIVFPLMLIVGLLVGTTSCKDKDIYPPMTGYWMCEGIGGTAFGATTPNIDSKYLAVFSVAYVGVLNGGYYTRVGAQDLTSVAGLASSLSTHTGLSEQSWENYFSYGSFTVDEANQTVTHTLKNGEVETFYYEMPDETTLKLTTQSVSGTGNISGTANTVINVINAFLGDDKQISTNVGVVYTYKKKNVTEILSALKNIASTSASE